MGAAEIVEWFVAFPAERALARRAGWRRLLARDAQHVLAAASLGAGGVLVLEHAGSRLRVATAPVLLEELLRDWRQRLGGLVLQVAVSGALPAPRLRGPMTCVEMVKAVLGIVSPLILTPDQLRRRLLADGATIISNSQAPHHPRGAAHSRR